MTNRYPTTGDALRVLVGDQRKLAFGVHRATTSDGPNHRRVSAWLDGHCLTATDDLVFVPSFCPAVRREVERFSLGKEWLFLAESSTDSEIFAHLGEVSERVIAYDLSVFRSLVFFCHRGRAGRLVYRLADSPRTLGGVSIEREEIAAIVGELNELVCGSAF